MNREYVGSGRPASAHPTLYALHPEFDPPGGYRADSRLAAAVNTAIFLDQPLLVTGDPGTGKTELANSVAWELDLPLHVFHTKSSSSAGDLFYRYDALLHFNDAHVQHRDPDMSRYIRFEALGRAIVSSMSQRQLTEAGVPAPLLKDLALESRSVVLIDEIDKAPRDFPNDILHEIDRLRFEVREADWKPLVANQAFRPIVILTSNLEKALPDAFLRRCVFYYIGRPTLEGLLEIVRTRLDAALGAPALLDEQRKPVSERGKTVVAAVKEFMALRDNDQLIKRPSTAEMLKWIRVLQKQQVSEQDVAARTPALLDTLHVLLKNIDDLRAVGALPAS
jgi:MoxR-like ATPase